MIPLRSFHTPMIRFIGKRSLTDKHVGLFASPASHVHTPAATPASTPAATPASTPVAPAAAAKSTGAKSLTPGAETVFADTVAARWKRLPFSEEEIQTINLGTNEVKDWRKVKL